MDGVVNSLREFLIKLIEDAFGLPDDSQADIVFEAALNDLVEKEEAIRVAPHAKDWKSKKEARDAAKKTFEAICKTMDIKDLSQRFKAILQEHVRLQYKLYALLYVKLTDEDRLDILNKMIKTILKAQAIRDCILKHKDKNTLGNDILDTLKHYTYGDMYIKIYIKERKAIKGIHKL